MKILVKLLLILLVLGAVVPLWLKDPAGRPVMVVEDWLRMPAQLDGLLAKARRALQTLAAGLESADAVDAGQQPESDAQYYRWQDERGRWHFSDQPPPDGSAAQLAELPQVRNSLSASPPVTPSATPDTTAGTAPPMDSNIAPAVALPDGVSREDMEQMLEAAHQRRMGKEL